MTVIGFHDSHEQVHPAALLATVRHAEEVGFTGRDVLRPPRHAEWADGLVTINQPHGTLRDVVAAYRDTGGQGELTIQVHLSCGPDGPRRPQQTPQPVVLP